MLLALPLLLGPFRPASARRLAPSPTELISEGDRLHNDQKYADAAKAYAGAYTAMSPEQKSSAVGLLVVESAAREYQQAFLSSGDIALLEASRDVLQTFVDDRTASGGNIPGSILQELRRVEGVLANLRPSPSGPEEPPEEETEETDEATERPPPLLEPQDTQPAEPSDRQPAPRRKLDVVGLGLTIAGGVLVVGGAVLLGVGAPIGPDAEERRDEDLDSEIFMMLSPAQQEDFRSDYDDWVDDEKRRGVAFMASGGAALGLGVALVIGGAVRLARSRSQTQTQARLPTLQPSLAPGRACVMLRGRF